MRALMAMSKFQPGEESTPMSAPKILPNPHSCAIREFTADGFSAGRCWYYTGNDDQCPRHGNVRHAMEHYRHTGELTDEQNHESHHESITQKTAPRM